MAQLNSFLLIGLPYAALLVFLGGTIYRYRVTKFTYSSLSSQFLESGKLFWGSMLLHWGLFFLFFGHLIAFLIPGSVLAFNSHPVRLLVLEISALVFGLAVLSGLVTLFFRRGTNERLRVVTTRMDVILGILWSLQVILGVLVAVFSRWGSSWFAAVLTPYLRSILTFRPEIEPVASLPWLIRLHIIGAYVLFLMIPFTRLVHLLVVPFHYIWRPYQRVIWTWNRRRVRHPDGVWTATRPKNN